MGICKCPCLWQAPLEANPRNSVIGFHDNSSALRGGPMTPTLPVVPGAPSALAPQDRDWDVLLTAETHNFPCAVAPYPGELESGAIPEQTSCDQVHNVAA